MAKKNYFPISVNEKKDVNIFSTFIGRMITQDRLSGWGSLSDEQLKKGSYPKKIIFPINLISSICGQHLTNLDDDGKNPLRTFLYKEVCTRIKVYIKRNGEYKLSNLLKPEENEPMFTGIKIKEKGEVVLLGEYEGKCEEYPVYNPPLSKEIIKGLGNLTEKQPIEKWMKIVANDESDISLDHYIPIHYFLIRDHANDIKRNDNNEDSPLVELSDFLFDCGCEWRTKNGNRNPFKRKKGENNYQEFICYMKTYKANELKGLCEKVLKSFNEVVEDPVTQEKTNNMRKAYFSFQLMDTITNSVKNSG